MELGTIVSVIGPVTEAAKCPLRIITHHLNYITEFRDNVENFQIQLGLFDARKNDIQEAVDTGQRNLQEMGREVEYLLTQHTEFHAKYVDDINFLKELDVETVKKCGRYKISKKALKLVEKIMPLIDQFNNRFPNVVMINSAPRTVMEMHTDYRDGLDSVETVRMKVMAAIRDANTTTIGLYGMGGIGKTTLMERINNDFLTDNSHESTYIINVTVSATPNISELQDKIAKRVGYKDIEKESDLNSRACKLRERLRKEKSILIILDDVWGRLDLGKLGIPSGGDENKCCKIVLTTRDKEVCEEMDAVPIIPMACLHPDESWDLFESKSGVVELESIRAIAKDVCKECAGLPLAISIVASALRQKTEEYTWNIFLSEMKESKLKELHGIDSIVYTPLKLSFDHLENDNQKLCFLFCSLFPEDHEIDLRDLMYYGLGEGFVTCCGGVSSLDRTLFLINKLKSRGLLLDAGRGEMYVKMHDVVRDVAISITRNDEKLDFYTNFQDLKKWPEGGESETIKRISLMGNQIQNIVDHPKFHGKWRKLYS